MTSLKQTRAPSDWYGPATQLWEQGDKHQAIQSVLGVINNAPDPKPRALALQLAYYLFLIGDASGATLFLERIVKTYPNDAELLRNLSVCQSRSGQYQKAVNTLEQLVVLTPEDPLIFDTYTASLSQLGQYTKACETGSKSLILKDQAQKKVLSTQWRLPKGETSSWVANKKNVVSFSLWGTNPRYLRGALDNAIALRQIYPEWVARFYVDDSVPAVLVEELKSLGAEISVEHANQSDRLRLAWRFRVANDKDVGYFLVRDVDSVVNQRERKAVDAWIASGKWFHVMRDWWTHTDLMLAGMWGGVAGVLPDMYKLLIEYRSPTLETPNIDQWFLRDCVWRYVRTSSLVHDRCFSMQGAIKWPEDNPPGNFHVGQDEYAVRKKEQSIRLEKWISKFPNLLQSPDISKESQNLTTSNLPGAPFYINIATPAYGSKYASVYLRTFYGLLSDGPLHNIRYSHSEIDYADVVTARNYLISNFYFNKLNHTHMLFIDDDMGFEPVLIREMLELKHDLVGVVYPRRELNVDALLANKEFQKRKAVALSTEFIGTLKSEDKASQFLEVSQCGTGIMLISRECVRLMIEKCPEIVDIKKFKKMPFGNKFEQFITPFNKIELEDRELSEDYSFCYRWTQLCGGKILASTSRQIQHVGQYVSQTQFSDRW
jgi:hypothetical protein